MLWVAFALAVVLAAGASAVGSSTKVQVSPGTGGVHTNFRLRFSIPDATGSMTGLTRSDSIVITGPSRKGCVGAAGVPLRAAAAHHTFNITLNPTHLDGHWCTGTFRGTLLEESATVCGPGPVQHKIMCPDYIVAPRVLGRFKFTVTQPGTGHKR
jgi:hypothetical protein